MAAKLITQLLPLLRVTKQVTVSLAFLVLILFLGAACQHTGERGKYENGFLYGPLMRLAANPDELIPDFSWTDHATETYIVANARNTGGAATGAGTGAGTSASPAAGCPT
jgi:hypothetical protein